MACLLNSENNGTLGSSAEKAFLDILSSGSENARSAVARHLVRSRTEISLEALLRAVDEDESLWVKFHALETLQLREPGSFPDRLTRQLCLYPNLIDVPDGVLNNATIDHYIDDSALADLESEKVLQICVLALASRHAVLPFLRIWALDSLCVLKADMTTPCMVAALDDEDPGVRKQALKSLHNTIGSDAIPYYKKALHDPDRDVRIAAILLSPFLPLSKRNLLRDSLKALADDPDPDVRFHALRRVEEDILPG
jgi:HEAT repeat protein